jgi:hypothetical protein
MARAVLVWARAELGDIDPDAPAALEHDAAEIAPGAPAAAAILCCLAGRIAARAGDLASAAGFLERGRAWARRAGSEARTSEAGMAIAGLETALRSS